MEPTSPRPESNFTHFVTFTLQPKLYGKSARQQLRATFNKANYELQRVCKSYKLVAELTKSCNIHYHAIVQFDQSEFFTIYDHCLILLDNIKSSNVFGRTESEEIRDFAKTQTYLTKDIAQTNRILNPRGKLSLDYTKDWTKGMKVIDVKKLATLTKMLDFDFDNEPLEEYTNIKLTN